jgi:hypothetical protein
MFQETAMDKFILIAVVATVAFGSANAQLQNEPSLKRQDQNDPVAADAEPAAKSGGPESQKVFVDVLGGAAVAPPGRVVATTVPASGARAPALVPMIPFVSYAPSNQAENKELQRQMQEIQEREQRMLQNPEYRDLLRARQRMALTHMHTDLSELLQISEEQADQLFDLLADQQVREQAASRPMWPSESSAAAQEMMEKGQERQRSNEAEIAALLGPEKMSEWTEYQQSAMARFQVQRLRQTLPAEAALRAEQVRPLVTAISREQRHMFEDRAVFELAPGQVPDEARQRRMHQHRLEKAAATNQRILDAASSILSPQQLQHFDALLQQELAGQSNAQFFFGRPLSSMPLSRERR